MGEKWNKWRVLLGNPEVKRPLGRRRRKWEYNIEMEPLRNRIGWYGVD
jgi:hypothetical protein